MAPFFEPPDPASEVVFERYYLAADFISGIGYGAQGARRNNKFMLAYITLLFLISTVVHVARAHRTQLVFIDNRNFLGGPWAYYEASYSGTSTVVGQIASMVVIFLSEMFMVWRCWVVWYSVTRRAAYSVAFIPALTLAASFACVVPFFLATRPDSPIPGVRTTVWLVSWYTLTLGSNVLATGLILARLIVHRRTMRETSSLHTWEHSSLVSMLVESAALYSIVGVGYLIATGVGSPVREPFSIATLSVQQISGYLIIARLAHGRGWQTSTTSIPSKIVFLGHAPAKDEEAGDKGEVLGPLKAISGTAE
ncbi:hypothetical protein BD779DRAFT_1671515 [Infundibulicybe gibba]|nr:hypothetical protein BD779DRAFT_1671515 [Infundibulicybe gibba]